MTTRKATAVWEGGFRSGKGTFKAESGMVTSGYSFVSRFDNGIGTNPEELLASAEACCFVMGLCTSLEKAGTPANRIEVHAACFSDKVGEHLRITTMKLLVRGTVPNIDVATFTRLCHEVKETSPVSTAIKGSVRIEIEPKLV
ncbi:MAG: OsmC family peroxiredoxin [Minicystis sp.]